MLADVRGLAVNLAADVLTMSKALISHRSRVSEIGAGIAIDGA